MASYLGNQHLYHIGLGELWFIKGFVATDSSGVPTNINDGTVLDQDGEPQYLPNGVLSVTKVANATGTYEIKLGQPWFKIRDAHAIACCPVPQATVVGTVAITGAVLTALDGLTLQTDASVGSNFTTTFATPATAQAVADQINANNSATSVFADIVTDTAGLSYLRVRDTAGGAASSLAIASASTGDTTLGMSNTTAHGQALGSMVLQSQNPKGSGVPAFGTTDPLIDAQSVTLVFESAGVATALPSAGFYFKLTLSNTNVSRS